MPREINQSQKDKQRVVPLPCARSLGPSDWQALKVAQWVRGLAVPFDGERVSVLQDDNSSGDDDGGDSPTTTPLSCPLTDG